ncbi:hypothetical protein BJ508DRAFT_419776 [Ascobolus immersus RN42]|uniref:Uncharacterized protein n=1 Tax=Ascobolus immersus RN42 TaxID=1160509 RepID=A0A3N4HBH4_ASCIM|nr:hypothetical protein BJ508DRAFT_419776 [Ascobolus immersus RN42]
MTKRSAEALEPLASSTSSESLESRIAIQIDSAIRGWKEQVASGTMLFGDYVALSIELLSKQPDINADNMHLFQADEFHKNIAKARDWDPARPRTLYVVDGSIEGIWKDYYYSDQFSDGPTIAMLWRYIDSIQYLEDIDKELPELLYFLQSKFNTASSSRSFEVFYDGRSLAYSREEIERGETPPTQEVWIFANELKDCPKREKMSPTALNSCLELESQLSRSQFFIGIAFLLAISLQTAYSVPPDPKPSSRHRLYHESEPFCEVFNCIEDYYQHSVFKHDYSMQWDELARRVQLELAREVQLMLIKMSLEIVIRQVRNYLRACMDALEGGVAAELPKAADHMKGGGLVAFFVELRAESVESRIWRYLKMDPDI